MRTIVTGDISMVWSFLVLWGRKYMVFQ